MICVTATRVYLLVRRCGLTLQCARLHDCRYAGDASAAKARAIVYVEEGGDLTEDVGAVFQIVIGAAQVRWKWWVSTLTTPEVWFVHVNQP
jgi:hypothetical protein